MARKLTSRRSSICHQSRVTAKVTQIFEQSEAPFGEEVTFLPPSLLSLAVVSFCIIGIWQGSYAALVGDECLGGVDTYDCLTLIWRSREAKTQ